jgi:hypothetical protein
MESASVFKWKGTDLYEWWIRKIVKGNCPYFNMQFQPLIMNRGKGRAKSKLSLPIIKSAILIWRPYEQIMFVSETFMFNI